MPAAQLDTRTGNPPEGQGEGLAQARGAIQRDPGLGAGVNPDEERLGLRRPPSALLADEEPAPASQPTAGVDPAEAPVRASVLAFKNSERSALLKVLAQTGGPESLNRFARALSGASPEQDQYLEMASSLGIDPAKVPHIKALCQEMGNEVRSIVPPDMASLPPAQRMLFLQSGWEGFQRRMGLLLSQTEGLSEAEQKAVLGSFYLRLGPQAKEVVQTMREKGVDFPELNLEPANDAPRFSLQVDKDLQKLSKLGPANLADVCSRNLKALESDLKRIEAEGVLNPQEHRLDLTRQFQRLVEGLEARLGGDSAGMEEQRAQFRMQYRKRDPAQRGVVGRFKEVAGEDENLRALIPGLIEAAYGAGIPQAVNALQTDFESLKQERPPEERQRIVQEISRKLGLDVERPSRENAAIVEAYAEKAPGGRDALCELMRAGIEKGWALHASRGAAQISKELKDFLGSSPKDLTPELLQKLKDFLETPPKGLSPELSQKLEEFLETPPKDFTRARSEKLEEFLETPPKDFTPELLEKLKHFVETLSEKLTPRRPEEIMNLLHRNIPMVRAAKMMLVDNFKSLKDHELEPAMKVKEASLIALLNPGNSEQSRKALEGLLNP